MEEYDYLSVKTEKKNATERIFKILEMVYSKFMQESSNRINFG